MKISPLPYKSFIRDVEMRRFFERIADYIRETDKILIFLCLAACLYGSTVILSATYYDIGFQRCIVQLIGTFLGLGVAVFISLFDYKNILKFWYLFAGLGFGLVMLTFFFGYAPEGTDDKAWLALPFGQSFQPSELLKVAFVISFTTHILKVMKRGYISFFNVFLLCIHGAIPVLLIHMQGDDGTAMVIFIMFLAMLLTAKVSLWYFAAAGGAVAVAAPILWFFVMNIDQKSRFLALLHPEQYEAIIYQQSRGMTAIGSGGFFGYGLFKGPYVQSGSIPLGYNDFIFASVGEELGFLGCMAVIALLCAICIRVLMVGSKSRDVQGKIICSGVFAMFAAQSVINIGMCLSLLPVIGITLPFFSAGGTSTVSLFLGIGLVLSIYKNRNRKALVLGD